MTEAEARKLWLEAVERVKDQTLAPTLWRALEAGTGVAHEGGYFVIGFPPSDAPMSGYLKSSEHKIIIEKVLTQLLGEPTQIRTIEGTTQADYEAFKKREAVAERTRRMAGERRQAERTVEMAWDAVSEQCSRKYANTPMRQMAHIRGQYMFEAIHMVSEALDRIHPDGKLDEVGHRAMARVLERIATLTDVPGAVVGAEFVRLRMSRKSS